MCITKSWLDPVSRPESAMPTLNGANGSGDVSQGIAALPSGPPEPSPNGAPNCVTYQGSTRWTIMPS